MHIKEIKPANFLFHRVETTVAALANHLPTGQKLFAEAVQKKLTITGPIHWHYVGFEGDEQKPFTLEIALPVAEVLSDYDGAFHFKRTESFRCVETIHEGGWQEIPHSYGKLMDFMKTNQLVPVALNREIYAHVDFQQPEANVTIIQMGIQ